MFSRLFILGVASFLGQVAAQEAGWDLEDGQVNSTLCTWETPRAAVIRDTLYIDGGYLMWRPGFSDGTYGNPIADDNPLGIVYLLSFNNSFTTSENISQVFGRSSKAPDGGAANNVAPQYIDGGMFADDFEWYTYGGTLRLTDSMDPPSDQTVAKYEVYQSGAPRQFIRGYKVDDLPPELTRYVTAGAVASAPSENLGFYFSGLRAASHGQINYLPGNDSLNADVASTTLIQVNMTAQQDEVWSNLTLPSTVTPRASAEIVWVPVSAQGILVAIGGVINPSFAFLGQAGNDSSNAASADISPGFMSTVSIYDIATQTWYEQETNGGPGALARGCTVLASAQDGSSHNIYWYGGYDGINPDIVNDDVWVLSIPSFVWSQVHSGNPGGGRMGHRCAKPYPDQMVVVGGLPASSTVSLNCLDEFVRIFNLSSSEWITSYNPDVWSNYTVPGTITSRIGGNGAGGATATAPVPSGFSDPSLAGIFNSAYPTSKITNWYPYQAAATPTNTPTPLPTAVSKSGTPKYLAPLLGVVLSLFFVTLFILGFMLWRRRKIVRSRAGSSEAGTVEGRNRITNWILGTPSTDAKAPTVTSTDETPSSPYSQEEIPEMQEVGDTQVHEMDDTSRPVELSSGDTRPTGFVPMSGNDRPQYRLTSSPSSASRSSTISHISRSSGPRPGISPTQSPILRADSPSLGRTSPQPASRVVSDMSGISDNERGHLRGISEASISSAGDSFATPGEFGSGSGNGMSANLGRPAPEKYGSSNSLREGVVSPITPPEGVNDHSGDYIGVPRAQSQDSMRRRSHFEERL
ncbi:kelch repeat protein [Phlyctema vagabunda]|uniref:Kelch repeat protein n=1 Tax=Phlyctema vagabunda TaxID=108571 RepID=A0ABR4PZ04_9HELO